MGRPLSCCCRRFSATPAESLKISLSPVVKDAASQKTGLHTNSPEGQDSDLVATKGGGVTQAVNTDMETRIRVQPAIEPAPTRQRDPESAPRGIQTIVPSNEDSNRRPLGNRLKILKSLSLRTGEDLSRSSSLEQNPRVLKVEVHSISPHTDLASTHFVSGDSAYETVDSQWQRGGRETSRPKTEIGRRGSDDSFRSAHESFHDTTHDSRSPSERKSEAKNQQEYPGEPGTPMNSERHEEVAGSPKVNGQQQAEAHEDRALTPGPGQKATQGYESAISDAVPTESITQAVGQTETSGLARSVTGQGSKPRCSDDVVLVEIQKQLRHLGIPVDFASSVLDVWTQWFYPEARRFYPLTLSLLRLRCTGPWWTTAQKVGIVEYENCPTIEETLYIYRYCVARQLKTPEILKMLKSDLEWREVENVEGIAQDTMSNEFRMNLYALYPHGYYGCDREGHPVYYDRIGKMKSKEILHQFNKDDMIKYWINSYENLMRVVLPACSLQQGRRIYQGVTVLDMEGISMGEFTRSRELLNMLLSIGQYHYPECMAKTYIIRSTWAFRAIWKLVKPLLADDTVKKVTIVDSGKELETLSVVIDPVNIPPFAISTNKLTTEDASWCLNPIGPWMDPNVRQRIQNLFPPSTSDLSISLQ